MEEIVIEKRIAEALRRAGRSGMRLRELAAKTRAKAEDLKKFNRVVARMKQDGKLTEARNRLVLTKALGLFPAEIVRVNKTFGFARETEKEQEIFIPGRLLKGSMPGDLVLVRLARRPRGDSPEGEVVQVVRQGSAEFSGKLVTENGRLCVLPDSFAKFPIGLTGPQDQLRAGQKVVAKITKRGERHSEHKAEVISCFGSADSAIACCSAVLELAGVSTEFPLEVLDEANRLAQKGIGEGELQGRLDLRDEDIFTIDGADSLDLDDAVSLVKMGDDYQLGVHIADVSHYVRYHTALDKEAFERGTSIYFANRVVPMLPKQLSNGICSLNPGEDRLAFSALLTVDAKGKLVGFDFKKSVIRSRVKGVYSEINAVLDGTADETVSKKYAPCYYQLKLMEQLARLLIKNKKDRGAPEIESSESKIILDKNDRAVDVQPRTRGFSERIIEEFMLLANEAAAAFAGLRGIPFVYRIHEQPSEDKLQTLKEVLDLLGINSKGIERGVSSKRLSSVIDKAQGKSYYSIVNNQVLRAMAKAKYSENPVGHYGLSLENYAHFTSPIRRYPDLMIHRILTELVHGGEQKSIERRYRKAVHEAALQSTNTELTAMRIERDCDDCFKAEYMKSHIGETFDGIISSVTSNGIYVELPNTVEGMVRIDSLEGQYQYDGYFQAKELAGGKSYRVGEPVRVQCTAADVNSGNIDFVMAD